MEELLSKARKELLAEGWSQDQVAAALDYARRWAQGNANAAAGQDPQLQERLLLNLMPKGLEQARQWLRQSRSWIQG